jgi:hypothetical protein
MIRTAFGLAALAAALSSAPAFAHHAFAMFDNTQVLYLSGTVKEFDLINPHAWLQVVVPGGNGDTSTWAFEGGSIPQLLKLGWSKDNLKPGDQVEVGYHPMKDGSRSGQLMSVKQANGQKVCSNRGCGDGSGEILPGARAQ